MVVTTKNEEKNISKCLESVRGQTYPQEALEVIVVDNYSTDRTKEIAQKYADKVFEHGPERSAQRNFGILKKSKGRYVMYLDADMRFSPEVVEIFKILTGFLLIVYLIGFVIVNSFLNKYGLASYELLAGRYVAAGLLFTLLCTLSVVASGLGSFVHLFKKKESLLLIHGKFDFVLRNILFYTLHSVPWYVIFAVFISMFCV